MMQIKKGVRLHGVIPQMIIAAHIYDELWLEHNYPAAITSGIEGNHHRASEHWEGHALDFRTWSDSMGTQMSQARRDQMGDELRRRLSDEYVVFIEKDHIHCHYRALKAD